jgi:hypothetical protein
MDFSPEHVASRFTAGESWPTTPASRQHSTHYLTVSSSQSAALRKSKKRRLHSLILVGRLGQRQIDTAPAAHLAAMLSGMFF